MKFIIFIFFFYSIAITTVHTGEIYKWLDVEGIKQFSNKPPPLSCRTQSCIKLNKKLSRKLQQRKDAELAHIEAQELQQEARDNQKQAATRIPASNMSQKTFLPYSTVLCITYNNIKEYKQVAQARKYLERDQVCTKTIEETEYTIIEQKDNFSNIRIYLVDGSSQKKWVESRLLIKN